MIDWASSGIVLRQVALQGAVYAAVIEGGALVMTRAGVRAEGS